MQQYGKKKIGSHKIHSHDKCNICGCADRIISVKTARQDAKEEIKEQLEDCNCNNCITIVKEVCPKRK